MRILTSNHYIANFTVPPQQSHTIKRVRFVNLGRLWSPALAIAAYPPMQSFDLAHFVNKIPVDLGKNWLVTFESALPRMFPPSEPLRRHLRRQLMAPACPRSWPCLPGACPASSASTPDGRAWTQSSLRPMCCTPQSLSWRRLH